MMNEPLNLNASIRALLQSLVLVACVGEGPLFDALEAPDALPPVNSRAAGAADAMPAATASSATDVALGAGAAVPMAPLPASEGSTYDSSPNRAPHAEKTPAPESRGDVPPRRLPKCVTKDSQVLLIGDSYINWISHSFPADLATLSGQKWRLEAIGGTSMATGGIGLIGLGYIPDQLDRAMAADPDAHTIVMSGGGNDVLVRDAFYAPNSCTRAGSSQDPGCQLVVSLAIEAARALILDAAALGIRDVVYFFYPHVPAFTFLTEDDPNEILDYVLPQARAWCENAETATGGSLRCTFIDMVPVFDGHPEWFNEDVHPNQVGGRVMAEKVWQVMEDHCLGQKGLEDCCEP